MFTLQIENRETIKAIYKENEPQLNHLFLHEFTIVTGQDTSVIIRIDTEELPQEMPAKWAKNGVNTVQLSIEFMGVHLNNVAIDNENFRDIHLFVEQLENKKKIKCLDISENEVFNLDAEWIFLRRLSGYQNEKKQNL